jgi:hypothetical protein
MKPEVIVADGELSQAVQRAIEQGRKIEAIKILREETGLGLANAKVLVDRAARQFATQNSQPLITESDIGVPRLLKSLFLAILLLVVYRYFVNA